MTQILSTFLLLLKFGASLEKIQDVMRNITNYPDLYREVEFLQIIGIFIFPAIICAWLFSDNYKEYLRIDYPVRLSMVVWVLISIVVAIPFLNFTYHLNRQMVLPEALKGLENWIKGNEEAAAQLLEKMLYADNLGVLIFNILIVCIFTGIGEEFMFRGLLQNLFGRVIRNSHAVIWIVAIVFSIVHFQFYGFLPRMLLGAWFGYLLYYTKTIWIPVLAHFTHNFISIIIYYIFQDTPQEMQEIDAIGTGSTWWLAVASFALFAFCFGRIKRDFSG